MHLHVQASLVYPVVQIHRQMELWIILEFFFKQIKYDLYNLNSSDCMFKEISNDAYG